MINLEITQLKSKNHVMKELIKELVDELKFITKVFMPSAQWEGVEIHDDAWYIIKHASTEPKHAERNK